MVHRYELSFAHSSPMCGAGRKDHSSPPEQEAGAVGGRSCFPGDAEPLPCVPSPGCWYSRVLEACLCITHQGGAVKRFDGAKRWGVPSVQGPPFVY